MSRWHCFMINAQERGHRIYLSLFIVGACPLLCSSYTTMHAMSLQYHRNIFGSNKFIFQTLLNVYLFELQRFLLFKKDYFCFEIDPFVFRSKLLNA